jgi:hypothetical protein
VHNPSTWELRQEDFESEASLSYTVKLYLKTNEQQTNKPRSSGGVEVCGSSSRTPSLQT